MHEEPTRGIEAGLRLASDSLLATLDELHELERAKRRMAPDSPEFAQLAARIERLAAVVLEHSQEQTRLANGAVASDAPERPIEDVPPLPIHVVLAEWRDAERAVAESAPGSEEHDRAQAAIRRLRREYRRAHEAVAGRRGSEPPSPG